MKKIIFIQKELEDRIGVMILSSYLRANGFSSEIVIDPYRNTGRIVAADPDFIGASVPSPSVDWALAACRHLKARLPRARIILGGPHPTFFPEVIEEQGVDAVCLGEGEKALARLMQDYDGSMASIEGTPNFWIKNGTSIVKNGVLPLLSAEELSRLPFADRSHYSSHAALRFTPHRRIWTSRGCPNSCAYCFNYRYKELYRHLGTMVRQRCVESVIEELKQLKKIGARFIDIVDDQFLQSERWIQDFSEAYKKHIDLPFVCNTNARRITADTAAALRDAGCRSVNFGVESGVERIRRKIYNKNVRDEHVYRAADILNSLGMWFLTYNMIGLPDETLEDMYRTVQINQEIGTTFPQCSILQPYPGTRIAEHIRNNTAVDGAFSYSFFQKSIVGDESRRRIVSNAQKLFATMVKSRTDFYEFVRLVGKSSIGSLVYPLHFYWHYGQGVRRRYGYSWPQLVKFWLYARN